MSFTDQKQRIATKTDLKISWSGSLTNFRCYLCGHKFIEGDKWRWVYGAGQTINFLVCDDCDGDDVLQRFYHQEKEYKNRYWYKRNH